MTKARIFYFLALLPLGLLGQKHLIQHDLTYDRSSQKLSGSTRISFPADLYKDSLLLHFPAQSLALKNSFYNQQLAEFQKVDAYYASAEETGRLQLDSARLNGQPTQLRQPKELHFVTLPAADKDSITLVLHYQLFLPRKGLAATGANTQNGALIDWLPRVAQKDSSGWQTYPYTYYNDASLPLDSFHLKLGLESVLEPVTNLKLQKKPQKLTPYFWVYQFAGTSRNLQVFWASQWLKLNLAQGVKVYSQEPSLMLEMKLAPHAKTISRFFKTELNDSLLQAKKWVYIANKTGEYQSAELLSLELPDSEFKMAQELAHARAQAALRYQVHPNGFAEPWLARGLPYFYKYQFIKDYFPQERWVPFSEAWWATLFDFDSFDYGYQNQFLYLFLARQGLDQSIANPVDSLSRLNYEGMVQGKTFLLLNHLRAYMGTQNFRRGMARYWAQNLGRAVAPQDLQQALVYYSIKPLDWFFEEGLHSAEIFDYQLAKTDHCPTVTTATVRNEGRLNLPYSLTGYKDGKAIITEWFQGHSGQRSVQLYNEDFDKVVLNDHLQNTEYRQKNNRYYPKRWLLKRAEPLNFAFYNSFEEPQSTQVFYFPSVAYNAYDQLLLGVNLSNSSILVQKPFEYHLNPNISTGTQQLTGSASARWNFTLPKSHFFRQITAGVYGRYFHYNQDLSFLRLSPSLNFRIRKPQPTSPLIQTLRLRAVRVDRELPSDIEAAQVRGNLASYTILTAGYHLENTNIFKPTIFDFNLEYSSKFSKVYTQLDQRFMLPNKKWLIARFFAGAFFHNRFAEQGFSNNFYSFGLSGTQDYLFDYYFIGRSDTRGLWSRQFFTTDGGFKSSTGVFANNYLLSQNLSVPLYSFVGLFGDVAWADGATYWDYGIRLAFITDFVEIYLPLQNHNRQFVTEANYLSNVRFVLDLKLSNIINRLRRGYY